MQRSGTRFIYPSSDLRHGRSRQRGHNILQKIGLFACLKMGSSLQQHIVLAAQSSGLFPVTLRNPVHQRSPIITRSCHQDPLCSWPRQRRIEHLIHSLILDPHSPHFNFVLYHPVLHCIHFFFIHYKKIYTVHAICSCFWPRQIRKKEHAVRCWLTPIIHCIHRFSILTKSRRTCRLDQAGPRQWGSPMGQRTETFQWFGYRSGQRTLTHKWRGRPVIDPIYMYALRCWPSLLTPTCKSETMTHIARGLQRALGTQLRSSVLNLKPNSRSVSLHISLQYYVGYYCIPCATLPLHV